MAEWAMLFRETVDDIDGTPIARVSVAQSGRNQTVGIHLDDPCTGDGLDYLTPGQAMVLAKRLPGVLLRAAEAAGRETP